MSFIRIAMAQINSTVGDLEGNSAKIVGEIAKARELGADIVTFPELALSGYPPEDLLIKPSFLKDCKEAIDKIARRNRGLTAIIGYPELLDGKVYNSAAIITYMKIEGNYRKMELPNYSVFDEKRYFNPGDKGLILDFNGVPMSLAICEDIWIEGGSAEKFASQNRAKIILCISASPFHAGKLSIRRDTIANFAKRTNSYVCFNNIVGGQDELVFDGGSLVIDSSGSIIANAKRFVEDMLIIDIQCSPEPNICESALNSDKQAKHQTIVLEPAHIVEREPVSDRREEDLGAVEEVYNALKLGTKDYIRKNGFAEVVLGLSGGIDSSLVAAIAVDAFDKEYVVGITMPSEFTSKETLADAQQLAKNLEMPIFTIQINSILSTYNIALKEVFAGSEAGIEKENLQARIRGNLLMAISNRYGWLVLSTGNKSETATGYCTLYGDMAGGYAVIKDVPKMLVYELARYVNQKYGREIIPQSVIDRVPTAELKPNQKDEDTLPPYPVLDPILKSYVEEDKSLDDIVNEGFDLEVAQKVLHMVDVSEYKRRQSCPGVKITPKSFGKDRRMPITNKYRAKVKTIL